MCAVALAGGTALADHHEGGGEAPTPEAMVAKPAGKIKAGAKVLIPKGLDDQGEFATGAWIEITPWASYMVNDKITAGVSIPLLLVSPDFGDTGPQFDALQAIIASGTYKVNDMLAGKVMAGMAAQGRMVLNPFGTAIGFYGSPGDLKFGGGAGLMYNRAMNKLHLEAGAMLIFQDASATDDMGEETALLTAQIPVMALYEVSPKLSAGVATGVYMGEEFSMDAIDGASVPLVVGAKFAVNPQLGVGGFAGLGSVIVPSSEDLGGLEMSAMDTLTLGLFAAWQQ
jgi:hypothetical protein